MSTPCLPSWRRAGLLGAAALCSLTAAAALPCARAADEEAPLTVNSGLRISPAAVPGTSVEFLNPGFADAPDLVAGGAMSTVLSPDGKTLLVVVSGHNRFGVGGTETAAHPNEYLFFYDVSANGAAQRKQVLEVPNSFAGAAFSPDGQSLFVSGGGDDNVHTYARQADGAWAESGTPVKLGHPDGVALLAGDQRPVATGVAVTPDGKTLVVANVENDSITVLDVAGRRVLTEVDLRPGKQPTNPQPGVAGGEFPFWVVLKQTTNAQTQAVATTAYVSSLRDREIVVVDLSNGASAPRVLKRVKVAGNPNKMVLDAAGRFLYVAEDNSDLVEVIDTVGGGNLAANSLVTSVGTIAPTDYSSARVRRYKGAATNSVALSPDGQTLYATNGGTNSVAVIRGLPYRPVVVGLLPTGFNPNAVAVSADGGFLYVVNGRDVTGPNPGETYFGRHGNDYVYEHVKSTLQSIPVPTGAVLAEATKQVAINNFFTLELSAGEQQIMDTLHERIQHVIYVVKENRTYDQILGDLDRGNGDPSLTDFPEAVTPNFHAISRQFVCLDNFYVAGDVSGDGQVWSVAARENDWLNKAIAQNYSGRGPGYDAEGANRNVNVGLATPAERAAANPDYGPSFSQDPDILPGTANVGANDGPDGNKRERGQLWDACLRAGLTFRNYGIHSNGSSYGSGPNPTPLERYPFSKGLRVMFPTWARLIPDNYANPGQPSQLTGSDPYFRGFDTAYPDFYREFEWEREFDLFVQNHNLPALEIVRLMEDHTGAFGSAIDGVNTPEIQQADNDYAVAKLIEKVARSPYKDSTLIFVLEDDAQDGADHVDAHRSTAYVVGPYVKQGAVVSTRYGTVNLLRTIEDVLGLDHLNILSASEKPMTEVFDLNQKDWSYQAVPSTYLLNTQLPIDPAAFTQAAHGAPVSAAHPTHDGAWWAARTAEFDFSREDNLKDPAKYNRIIWEGLHGDRPYPRQPRTGADLRVDRASLLRKSTAAATAAAQPAPVAED